MELVFQNKTSAFLQQILHETRSQEQTAELDEFDDALVRKLVEQVVVHGDGTFTVAFKSGARILILI